MIISVLIKSLGKDKSDIYIISENYGISNNIKREKPEKKILHREGIPKNGSAKSSESNTDVSNQILIMGKSIVKHVRRLKNIK